MLQFFLRRDKLAMFASEAHPADSRKLEVR